MPREEIETTTTSDKYGDLYFNKKKQMKKYKYWLTMLLYVCIILLSLTMTFDVIYRHFK